VTSSRPRYYWTRDRSSGKYKIIDRDLHNGMVIAEADFKEASAIIVLALNNLPKASQSERPPRHIVFGDILLTDQLGSPRWIAGVATPRS
jgi:hypothetical protein